MLDITFINVGYGESILLEEKSGGMALRRILIDGGSMEDEEYSGGKGRIRTRDYLAQKGIDEIDLAIVTHIHEDHNCGLEQFVNAGGRVKKLLTPCLLPPNAGELPVPANADSGTRKFINALNSFRRLFARLQEQGVPVAEVDGGGGSLQLTQRLTAQVMAPSPQRTRELSARFAALYQNVTEPAYAEKARSLSADLNGYSLVLMLAAQGKKILLPGDATPASLQTDAGFRRFFETGALQAHILKLPHHGQADSVTEPFIKAVSPEMVITCSSSDRRYESAHPLVYQQIETWLERKPAFLFADNVDIQANTLCRTPHSALGISIDESGEVNHVLV